MVSLCVPVHKGELRYSNLGCHYPKKVCFHEVFTQTLHMTYIYIRYKTNVVDFSPRMTTGRNDHCF